VSGSPEPIPIARPDIGPREEELVLEVLRSGNLSLGPMGPRFERAFADWLGVRHAAAVSSGTAGLHLLAHLAGAGPGGEVITSPFSFVASANCALYTGADVVFADIDPATFNLDPAAVEVAITPRTKAIVAVHVFGLPCRIEEIRAVADRHGVAVIEDAAEALGARRQGRLVGTTGSPAVFAFYPNKQMTTGEGGVVTTDDDAVHEAILSLRNQGRADSGQWLAHDTTAWTTCRRPSASRRSSGSTASSRAAPRWRTATARSSPGSTASSCRSRCRAIRVRGSSTRSCSTRLSTATP